MSESSSTSAGGKAASADASASTSNASNAGSSSSAPNGSPKKGNPAFRMMGLPRLRLPSRNWLIFLSITGSFASAVIYDKYETRRVREKWCRLVSHIAEEPLPTHTMPRKVTVYLAAPPGEGLRMAREHFLNYVKPVLVAGAMDWDVVEGRKEGDVRFKTAERIRKKRKRNGEGEVGPEAEQDMITVEGLRKERDIEEWNGVAGDLIVGRHTWKEYVRGLHEGWLGPVDPPKAAETEQPVETASGIHNPGSPSLVETPMKEIAKQTEQQNSELASGSGERGSPEDTSRDEASPSSNDDSTKGKSEENKGEEEKPKPRQPPPYIQPSDYEFRTPSSSTPDSIGPSIGVRFPHLLGFRNTPIRIYRFLNRRHLADSIGRDVAAAVLAAYRPYSHDGGLSSSECEQAKVLQHEERDWWKTTFEPRKEHEESVWIEDLVLDQRIANRMQTFQLTADEEDRAQRIREGKEAPRIVDPES